MMRRIAALLFLIAALHATPVHATGAAATPAPKLEVAGEDDAPISNETIKLVLDNCKFNIPQRFTPEAREYFCTCNAAALQGNFRNKELRQLQIPANRRAGNAVFEKYMTNAVAPCLDQPVEQIEYLSCLLDYSLDQRIRYVPGHCKCVSRKIRDHARQYGLAEMMVDIAKTPTRYREPLDALWNNSTYIGARLRANEACLQKQQ